MMRGEGFTPWHGPTPKSGGFVCFSDGLPFVPSPLPLTGPAHDLLVPATEKEQGKHRMQPPCNARPVPHRVAKPAKYSLRLFRVGIHCPTGAHHLCSNQWQTLGGLVRC